MRYCELLREYDLSGRLGAIAAPTLAIAGAEDPTSPPEHVEAIAAGDSRRARCGHPRRAHLVERRAPGEFNLALLAHLA